MWPSEKHAGRKKQYRWIRPPSVGFLVCLSAALQCAQWAMVIVSRPIGSPGARPIFMALRMVEIRSPFGLAVSFTAFTLGLWAAIRAAFRISDALEIGGAAHHAIWSRILMLVIALCCLFASLLLMRHFQALWTE